MGQITLSVSYNVRNYHKRVHNFGFLAGVSGGYNDKTANTSFEKPGKIQVNDPEWSVTPNTGLQGYFKKHNGFKDQELYNRKARGYVIRQGTDVKYYTTTYDASADPLYHEDNDRIIDRVFDLPIITSFQPESELYARFGIQQLDETEIHCHMGLFLELNYASLRKHAIEPKCPDTEHCPIFSQRGYDNFRYYGYTYDQIGPKPGDKLKIEAFDILYEVKIVKDASPEHQHRWRKYFWKMFLKNAMDLGQTVSDDVLSDPEQNEFLNDLMGIQTGNVTDSNGNPVKYDFDVSDTIDEIKKDVIFRPPEVPRDTENISEHPYFHPGEDKFGNW